MWLPKITLIKKTHIISVNTHYYGPLIKGKYQFTFGENKEEPALSGFLIPDSGRTKKIATRFEIMIDNYFDDLTGSFLLTKTGKKKKKKTNKVSRLHSSMSLIAITPYRFDQVRVIKFYFDNDLENYPISEGDLINIRTEKDYSKYIVYSRIEDSERERDLNFFFQLFHRIESVFKYIYIFFFLVYKNYAY